MKHQVSPLPPRIFIHRENLVSIEGCAHPWRILRDVITVSRCRAALICSLLAVLMAWPSAAQGASCDVEVTGADSPEWQAAAQALLDLALTEEDCSSVQVAIARGGARLVFTTVDGRRADRQFDNPLELVPTVEALRLAGASPTIPSVEPSDAPPRRRAVPSEASASSPRREAPASAREPGARVSDDPPPSSPQLAVLGGARGGGDALWSPLLETSLLLLPSRWELGASASVEVRYFELQKNDPSQGGGSAFASHVSGGRRQPIGVVDLLFGARLSFALLLPANQDGPACSVPANSDCIEVRIDERVVEGRIGAYVGAVGPRGAARRYRAEFGADLVPSDRKRYDLVFSPFWAVSARLGVEFGGWNTP